MSRKASAALALLALLRQIRALAAVAQTARNARSLIPPITAATKRRAGGVDRLAAALREQALAAFCAIDGKHPVLVVLCPTRAGRFALVFSPTRAACATMDALHPSVDLAQHLLDEPGLAALVVAES